MAEIEITITADEDDLRAFAANPSCNPLIADARYAVARALAAALDAEDGAS